MFYNHPGFVRANAEHVADALATVPGERRAGVHIAFTAHDRAVVDRFYEAAIAAGATDNGPPSLRPHYHANYYGAFVLDPDGNNIEAVCHAPQGAADAVSPDTVPLKRE